MFPRAAPTLPRGRGPAVLPQQRVQGSLGPHRVPDLGALGTPLRGPITMPAFARTRESEVSQSCPAHSGAGFVISFGGFPRGLQHFQF